MILLAGYLRSMCEKGSKLPGFNLVEVILSIGLFAALVTATVPVYRTFQVHNDLTLAAGATAQALRRAQWEARASSGDTTWGVNVQTGAVTLFRGASYATRDTDYDDVYVLGSSITPTGLLEVVFDGVQGDPDGTGTLTLTGADGSVETVTIGAYGQVAY